MALGDTRKATEFYPINLSDITDDSLIPLSNPVTGRLYKPTVAQLKEVFGLITPPDDGGGGSGGGISQVYVDNDTITGDGTIENPLVAHVTAPVGSISTDGSTIIGDGSAENPLQAVGGGGDGIDEGFQTVGYASSQTVDLSTHKNFIFNPLTGNMTLAFTGVVEGREYKMIFIQGGSGGYRVTFPAGTKIAFGFGTGNVFNNTTTLGARDWVTMIKTSTEYNVFPAGMNMV